MTIVDAPMNIVYGVVLLGFVAMTFRSIQVALRPLAPRLERARAADDHASPTPRRRVSMLKIIFLLFMSSGIPVAIAMAGASLVYILISRQPAAVRRHPPDGERHRQLPAARGAVLHPRRQPDEQRRHHRPASTTSRSRLVGWMKGGLGHVNVIGSVIFAGMSGTAIADAAGLGTIEIKAMKEHGYSTEFAVGVTAASATLGPIIPPSLPFVIYGMMANVSVGALFLAGILPGRADGDPDDAHGRLLRAQEQMGRRRQVLGHALRQGDGRAGGGHRLAAAALGGGGAGRRAAADLGASSPWRCCSCSTASSASRRCCRS